MKIISILVMCLLSTFTIKAQQILKGKVSIQSLADAEKEMPAIGAKVKCLQTGIGTTCNPDGEFQLALDASCKQIIVSYIGYKTDTINIKDPNNIINIVLITKKSSLKNINVYANKPATQISFLTPNQHFVITQKELRKAACCNLSESFETTPSIDVSYSDAITGQKQIQLLGLATPNTMITHENIPMIRGLSSIVGLNYTPGTWVSSMQLSKGTGSVANGYEGAAGQINVELVKPNEDIPVSVNLYQNSGGRTEANVNLAHEFNHQLSAGLLLHHKNQWRTTDMQHDGFMDNPLGQQNIGLFRMQYFSKKGTEIQGGIKYTNVTANGGEIHPHGLHPFNYNAKNVREEAWLKIGQVFKNKPWKSIGWQHAIINDKQKINTSIYDYTGNQKTYYTNLIFQSRIGNTNHSYRTGVTYINDLTHESTPDIALTNIHTKEQTAGVFAEHTYAYLDNFTVVTGMRLDHSSLYGLFATPRLHIRYSKNGKSVFRLSTGRAQRTANVISENQQIYFTNRTIKLTGTQNDWQEKLQREIAWNNGASYSTPFEFLYKKGTFVFDYYYTAFLNSIIADYENPKEITFFNLKNNHKVHSAQAQVDYNLIRKKLDLRLAYRFVDTRIKYNDGRVMNKPLQSFHRAFANISYINKRLLDADMTIVWNGKKRLPNSRATNLNPQPYSEQYSPNFITINGQISKTFKTKHYTYLGVENATNYMQHHPIITTHSSAEYYLDATQTWGPIMGINVYLGYTYTLKKKEDKE